MRFLMNVIDDGQAVAGQTASASEAEAAAIDRFNERLEADGHWITAGGLSAPEQALVIDARGAETVATPGTVAPLAPYVAGFWLVEAPDAEAAQALATAGSAACNRRVELRQVL